MTSAPEARRIDYLDGLRGLAILGVMLWHYTDEVYAALLPYGAAYASIPIIDRGWVGVNLFFLISGFVILLSLERYPGYGAFLKRRWLRLFPAMLIASLIVFGASQINADHMPHGRASIQDLMPGLTFISVGFYAEFLPFPVRELDGVYWTLYVEAGFYVVFGALFYALGWQRALTALAGLWVFVLAGADIAAEIGHAGLQTGFRYLQWIGAEYFGWFVSGALFYKARQMTSLLLFLAAIVTGLVSAMTSDLWQPDDLVSQLHLCGCVILFALALKSPQLQTALRIKPMIFMGFISYPLYLLHNEFGIGLISAVGAVLPSNLSWAPAVFVAGVTITLSYIVAKLAEPALRKVLQGRIQ
ncbi:MAG: acyltransferase [Pseudomonadota bacterium]